MPPTPPNIPYGLSPVTSSAEYANESIEFDEPVSAGTWVERNVNLSGSGGGVPAWVGESGSVSGNVFCFVGVYLLLSASIKVGGHKRYAAYWVLLVLFPNSPISCPYPLIFLKFPLSGRGVVDPFGMLVVLVTGRLCAPAPAPFLVARLSFLEVDPLAKMDGMTRRWRRQYV